MAIDSNRIDYERPNVNMYGCLPYPRCKSEYRWPRGDGPIEILCDDCGHTEQVDAERETARGT